MRRAAGARRRVISLACGLAVVAAACGATGGDEPTATPEMSVVLLESCEGTEETPDPPAMAATVAAAWLRHEERAVLDVGEVVAAHGCTDHGLWGTVRSPANLVVLLVEPVAQPRLESVAEVAAACADERLPAPLRAQLEC